MQRQGSSPSEFINVCDKELNIAQFHDVYDKIRPLSAHWRSFAISLRLRIADINTIEANSRGNTISCLQMVLEYWLKKNYDSHGIPCWRIICVAVKEGGGDSALADEIAREHPLPATIERVTPSHEYHSSLGSVSSTDTSIYACIPERNFSLVSKIHDLQIDFADAIRSTRQYFKPSLLPDVIEYLETHIHALLGLINNNQAAAEAIKNEFSNIKTMKDLFTTLQYKYVSWFNYELIVKLVRVFLTKNRTLKRTWSEYEEKLKDYFINSGGLLKDVEAEQFGIKDVPPGTRVMIAKVERDDYTLVDLFFFRRAIPKEFDVPEMRFYFSAVKPGSLQFRHLIPEYLYSLLFPLTTKQQQQLASIGITELTCGEHEYDLRKVK